MYADLARKFAKYFVSGGIAAVIDAGGFTFFCRLGVPPLVAAASSFLISALVNFRITSALVFERPATWGRACAFFAGALIGLVVNVAVTIASMQYLEVSPFYAKVIGIGSAFTLNYLLNYFFVFRRI